MKVVIIGNAGAGKTWLSRAISDRVRCTVVELDDLFWMLGGPERDPTEEEVRSVDELIEKTKSCASWVAEGAHSHLARRFIDSSDGLIWLDLDWQTCRDQILRRRAEAEQKGQSTEGSSDWVLEWAEGYYDRNDGVAWKEHSRLFSDFSRAKWRLKTGSEVEAFLQKGLSLELALDPGGSRGGSPRR